MADGYARRDNSERDIQPVQITAVNAAGRSAVGMTRIRTNIDIDCSYSTGETTVVPAVDEQWYVERFDAVWRLYGRIPFQDPTLLTEPVEGQAAIGGGKGPILLHGETGGVNVLGDLVINGDHYRSVGAELQKQTGDGSWVPVIPASGAFVLSTDVSDSTALGRTLLTIVDAAAARSAIGAGTYVKPGLGIPKTDLTAGVQASLSLADTAKQNVGATDIFDATTIGRQLLTAATTNDARAILNIGTGVSVSAADIVDSTTVGRAVLTASTPAAARAALGVSATVASTDITDSTTVGRAVLTATDAAAARTAIGAGVGSYSKPGPGIPGTDLATGVAVAGSVNGTATNLTLWTGTAAQYAAIPTKSATTVYVVTA